MSRRITLVIPSLAGGGAERVMALMANHWAERGDRVTLITFDSADSDKYHVGPAVERIALGEMHRSPNVAAAVWISLQRLRRLRRAIRDSQPDHVISFIDKMNVATLLACAGLGLEIVVSERVDPTLRAIGRGWSWLRRLTYPRCRALVVQTEAIRDTVRSLVRDRPVYVIPNPVQRPAGEAAANDRVSGEWWSGEWSERQRPLTTHHSPLTILAMGRLDPQKGFDLLIEAFSRIAARHPHWTLQILGEGPQRDELERLIRDKDLTGRVELAGWVAEPFPLLCRGDLFVLSSRFEGFPNALLEALACGLPAISFDCPGGPAEIVRDGIDGLLVPAEDVAALAAALDRLISDEPLRERLAARAREVEQRFGVERFFEQWDAVLCRDGEPLAAAGSFKSERRPS